MIKLDKIIFKTYIVQLEQQFIRPTFTFSNFGSVVFDYDVDVGGDAVAIRRAAAACCAIVEPPPTAPSGGEGATGYTHKPMFS